MSKELYETLKSRGSLEFGSYFYGHEVRKILGIEYPEIGTKEQFDEVALAELGAIDYVRNILLNEGKYLQGAGGNYRILLPSETQSQVENYMRQADKKLKRALRLSQSMPKLDSVNPDNSAARIMLKREAIRSRVAA